jgi:hypothetical protein
MTWEVVTGNIKISSSVMLEKSLKLEQSTTLFQNPNISTEATEGLGQEFDAHLL